MTIYQGDQYKIPFIVKLSGSIVTPEAVQDIRIQLANELYSMSNGTLDWNEEKQSWDVTVTETLTRALNEGYVPYQVGVKIGDVIRYSPIAKLNVSNSIIKAVWADG